MIKGFSCYNVLTRSLYFHTNETNRVWYKTEAALMFPGYFTWQVYSRNYLDSYLFFLFVATEAG